MPDVLTVAPNETPERIHARLAQVRGREVYLVIPRTNRALRNQVTLAVLARRARARGLDLTLVTHDGTVRVLARQVGLPVRWSLPRSVRRAVAEAPAGRGPGGTATVVQPSLVGPWARLLAAFVLLALGLALVFLLLPHATVVVPLASQPLEVTLELFADPRIGAPDAATGRVPARRVEVTLQRRVEQPTQVRESIPDRAARGMVSFQNQSETAVTIPAGTVVSTSTAPPIRFRTLNSVRLPPRAGSTVQVLIRAEEPGPEGNVPAFAIDTLDPRLGVAVAVVNERPTEGGTTREIGIVTAEERARVRDALLAQLRREALDVLETQLQPGENLVADTAQVRVIEERYGQEIGAQSDVIEVELTIRATALAVAMAQAQELATSVLRDRVPTDYALDDDTLQARVMAVAAEGDGVRLQVTASATAWAEVTKRDVRNAVRGQRADEAIAILEREFELADRPEIRASRLWLGRMPWLPLRIDVILVRNPKPQT